MKPRRACVVVLLLTGLAGAWGSGRPPKVVIGVGMGVNSYPGLRLAAREINAAGGIGGVPLELVGLDPDDAATYDPAAVVQRAARFNDVPYLVAVVGHSDSAATLTAAPSYNRDAIPQIVAIASSPAITGIGPWTYRVCLSDAVQGPALADYAVRTWKKARLGIVYVNDDYGRGLARLFEDRARSLGATIVATAAHRNALQPDDRETIREAVRDMKQGGVDLVVLFQRVSAATWTVDAIREAGLDAAILGSDDLAQYAFPRQTTGSPDGIRVSQFVHLDESRPDVARFVGRIRTETGEPADSAQALSYDAIYLLRDAVLGGGYSRQGVKAYLDRAIRERREFGGIAGAFTLGDDHDARRPLFIAEIRERRFHLLEPLGAQ